MMEIERESCDSCGETHEICSECGSNFVTPIDYIEGANDHHVRLRDAVLNADSGDELVITQVCWDCGAETKRTLNITVAAA